MLEVDDIRYTYPGETGATIHANFTIPTGGITALMGASGAGKTTILNLIAGLLTPTRGAVRFNGEDLRALQPAARPLTYLFQADNLFAHLTVRQNIAVGLHPGMRLTAAQNAAVDRALEWVSLNEFAARKPPNLSGGQQQRAALARCLARNRPLLLLDEPFTALDETLRNANPIPQLQAQQKSQNQTILLTTHQQQDAEMLGAEVVVV